MSCAAAARLAVLALLVLLAGPAAASAASTASDGAWTRAPSSFSRGPTSTGPDPRQSAAFTLHEEPLQARLDRAPDERSRAARSPQATVSLPAPDGTLQRFRVVESPVMAPALAAKVPEFTSYAGIGVDDPTATARLDLSPLGVHATVRTASGTWFVDPAPGIDPDRHLAYRGTANESAGLQEPIGTLPEDAERGRARPEPGGPVVRREYRLALASDPSYATAFPAPGEVDEAKAALVNRANQVYNADLQIKLVLIAGNDELNYPTAPEFATAGYLSAECTDATLSANQASTDLKVGSGNYDVGHLISAGTGGGVAGLGVVGRSGEKAKGCSRVNDPRGDAFAIDYFAHEVGHQFAADHTFDGGAGSCGDGNRNAATSVEPGSGSSIMAYAGICGADNLQGGTDPWFSQRSITEIQAYVGATIAGAQNGGTPVPTGNHTPVVSVPSEKAIPPRTPFTLTGEGSDPDGNPLVYLWEQNDASSTGRSLVSNAKPDGALFRQFGTAAVISPSDRKLSPSPGQNIAVAADKSRTFPDPAQVASGNTNAASGSCPEAAGTPTAAQVECFSEFLPTSARTLHFRLTARDQALGGGGESSADTRLDVTDSAPFRLSSQAAPAAAAGLSAVTVTWDVASTRADPICTADVRILYSTDGGLTFPTVLVARTANDGARTVTVPDLATTGGRFRVEASGNYYFDVSAADLTVSATGGPAPADPDPDLAYGTPTGACPGSTDPPPTAPTAALTAAPAAMPPARAERQPPVSVPPTLTGEAAKNPAKIRVLRAGVAGERLDVLAEITRRASGAVRVSYRSGGTTVRFDAPITNGRVRFKQRLRGANARKTTGIFTLTYAGDEDVRADEVRLRAARRPARLRRTVTRIQAGILEVAGTVSDRARGVVSIRMEYLAGSELVRDRYRASIRNGRWRLSAPLPAAAAVAGGQLAIQYTGYEPARMRGEQSGKRVRPG